MSLDRHHTQSARHTEQWLVDATWPSKKLALEKKLQFKKIPWETLTMILVEDKHAQKGRGMDQTLQSAVQEAGVPRIHQSSAAVARRRPRGINGALMKRCEGVALGACRAYRAIRDGVVGFRLFRELWAM